MSAFTNKTITNAGLAVIADKLESRAVEFTRIVMGDGMLPPGTVMSEMTDVINHVVDVDVNRVVRNNETSVTARGLFSNTNITHEFIYREQALFARIDNGAEIMYCYANAGNNAQLITPVDPGSVIEKIIGINTIVGRTTELIVNITRAETADNIWFDDSISNIGAVTVQEAIDKLKQNLAEDIIRRYRFIANSFSVNEGVLSSDAYFGVTIPFANSNTLMIFDGFAFINRKTLHLN